MRAISNRYKMAKRKIDYDKYAVGIFKRTEGYADKVRQHFESAVDELLKISSRMNLDEDEVFSFSSSRRASREANDILRNLYSSVYQEIKSGISMEWEYANLSADALIRSIFGKVAESDHFAQYFMRNQQAMDAFFSRSSARGGLNLSQNVWNYTGQLKKEMELALSVSMGKGESASTISRRVRQYLREPDKLFRRVRDEKGNLKLSKSAAAYHPGRGVYRSSYKNAMRLTRTETNMAYRTADHLRWQQMDFVIGIEIHVSNNHPAPDICDDLKGRYPKDFKFVGWHPQCRCFVTPILADLDKMLQWGKDVIDGKTDLDSFQPQQIHSAPEGFVDWIKANGERIKQAESLPYWYRDNVDMINTWSKGRKTPKEIGAERHAKRTAKEAAVIRQAWANHNMIYQSANHYRLRTLRERAKKFGADISELENFIRTKKLKWKDKYEMDIVDLEDWFDYTERIIEKAEKRFWKLKGEAGDLILKYYNISKDIDAVKQLSLEFERYKSSLSPLQKDLEFDAADFRKRMTDFEAAVNKLIKENEGKIAKLRADAVAKNLEEMEKALGIKRGDPMTFEQADERRGNPNYGTDRQYSINCQTCVPANEMRRRGFDVSAMGNNNDEIWQWFKDNGMNNGHKSVWLDHDGSVARWRSIDDWRFEKKYKRFTRKRVDEFIDETCAAEGRYEIRCTWDSGTSGHVFCIERDKKGVLKIWDPQNGSHDIMYYFDSMIYRSIEILRIDDKVINPKFAARFVAN